MMLIEEFHNPRPPEAGYVYLMRNETGYYKIGHSVNPRRRRKQQSREGNTVKIVLIIPTNDMIALELDLQRRYQGKQKSGEWFKLGSLDIDTILRQTPRATRYNPDTFNWKA